MVALLIVVVVVTVASAIVGGLIRDRNFRDRGVDRFGKKSPAVTASEIRTAGHIWLFATIIALMLLVGTIRAAGRMPLLIAETIAVIVIGVIAWCGLHAFLAYRTAYRTNH